MFDIKDINNPELINLAKKTLTDLGVDSVIPIAILPDGRLSDDYFANVRLSDHPYSPTLTVVTHHTMGNAAFVHDLFLMRGVTVEDLVMICKRKIFSQPTPNPDN